MKTRLMAVLFSFLFSGAVYPGFLSFPLHGCSDPSCTVNYATHGAYSANAMNSVLDHSMALNSSNYYPYGTTKTSTSGGNSVIKAFNGEMVSGALLSSDFRCVGGTINLHPDWNPSVRMTNNSGCGANYSSYDEHPGYDYKAVAGTPVYAAQAGTVISTIATRETRSLRPIPVRVGVRLLSITAMATLVNIFT